LRTIEPSSASGLRRQPPNVAALLALLDRHGVRYVVTGSVAALLSGVPLEPGDLDVTPALDRKNLERLAGALDEVAAHQDPDGPYGRWQVGDDSERRWVQFEPTGADREARASWRPDPANPDSFDHLLRTSLGALDIVPEVAGSYETLRPRAAKVVVEGRSVRVESIADQLATLTVPRRAKDADRVRALRKVEQARLTNLP
jgi:hypothetical protein